MLRIAHKQGSLAQIAYYNARPKKFIDHSCTAQEKVACLLMLRAFEKDVNLQIKTTFLYINFVLVSLISILIIIYLLEDSSILGDYFLYTFIPLIVFLMIFVVLWYYPVGIKNFTRVVPAQQNKHLDILKSRNLTFKSSALYAFQVTFHFDKLHQVGIEGLINQKGFNEIQINESSPIVIDETIKIDLK